MCLPASPAEPYPERDLATWTLRKRLGKRNCLLQRILRGKRSPLAKRFEHLGASPYQVCSPYHPQAVRNRNNLWPASCNVSSRLAKWNRIKWFTGSAKKLEPGTAATPISLASQ
jgi:hypothetical protein